MERYFDWNSYYNRWFSKILNINKKEELLERVIKKYSSTRAVGKVNIFDCLFEYAKRYGVENNILEDNDGEPIIEEYTIDGYNFRMIFAKHSFITIYKNEKDRQ